MLLFLKNILQSKYTQKRLDLEKFDLEEVYNANSLNDFEIAFGQECYKYKENKIGISDDQKQNYFV